LNGRRVLNIENKEVAALLVKDEFAASKLFTEMVSLAKDKDKQDKLRNNIGAFAVTNADEKIAKISIWRFFCILISIQ